jgi:2-phosphoglycerate kinase
VSVAAALSADTERSWSVLLLGGPSGAGKTSVGYPLARHFGVGITEIDDLYIAAKHLTTPAQQPVLHAWDTTGNALELPAERILDMHIAASRVLSPLIAAVIANHVETQTPIVLEGDYLLPEVLAQTTDRVAEVFLYEPEEAQLLRNFALREPGGDQVKRARVSWLFGQWLRDECGRFGLIAMPSRPWDTLLRRIVDATR